MEKENIQAKTGQKKMTRGKVDVVDRLVWAYMKKQLALTEARLVQLNIATCPAKVNGEAATLVRMFDPNVAKEKGVTIEDYERLNEHPQLILYEGYRVHGRGGEFKIDVRNEDGPSLLDKKIQEGAITEVGVIIEKTGAAKWLGRFGTFMMMGGFLVVLVLIVAIIIAISILSKGC